MYYRKVTRIFFDQIKNAPDIFSIPMDALISEMHTSDNSLSLFHIGSSPIEEKETVLTSLLFIGENATDVYYCVFTDEEIHSLSPCNACLASLGFVPGSKLHFNLSELKVRHIQSYLGLLRGKDLSVLKKTDSEILMLSAWENYKTKLKNGENVSVIDFDYVMTYGMIRLYKLFKNKGMTEDEDLIKSLIEAREEKLRTKHKKDLGSRYLAA